jgi:hypothetical protein
MGLGLAICRRIIEGHDGQLSAFSDGKSGARFEIILPIQLKRQSLKRSLFAYPHAWQLNRTIQHAVRYTELSLAVQGLLAGLASASPSALSSAARKGAAGLEVFRTSGRSKKAM